jgi:hypothetical protein
MDGALTVPSAGEMLEGAIPAGDPVGVYVGRDEPAEFSYDYAEADRRALNVLKRVASSEKVKLDPDLVQAASPPGAEQAPPPAPPAGSAPPAGVFSFFTRRRG